ATTAHSPSPAVPSPVQTSPSPEPSTPATSPAPTGAEAACEGLNRLFFAFQAGAPNFDQITAYAKSVIDLSATLDDRGAAKQVADAATDALDAAKAFQADDIEKGGRLENKAIQEIPAA